MLSESVVESKQTNKHTPLWPWTQQLFYPRYTSYSGLSLAWQVSFQVSSVVIIFMFRTLINSMVWDSLVIVLS